MIDMNNRELTIDELDIATGGKDGDGNGTGTGGGDGLGRWRRLAGEIAGAVGGVLKTIGGIFGL
jgi:hypothetical protein